MTTSCERIDNKEILSTIVEKIKRILSEQDDTPRSVDKLFAEVALDHGTTLNVVYQSIWKRAYKKDPSLSHLYGEFKKLVTRKRSLDCFLTSKLNKNEEEAIAAECERLFKEGKSTPEIYTYLAYKFDRGSTCLRNITNRFITRYNTAMKTMSVVECNKDRVSTTEDSDAEKTNLAGLFNKVCALLDEFKNTVQFEIEKAEAVKKENVRLREEIEELKRNQEAFLRTFNVILSKREENEKVYALKYVVDKYGNVSKVAFQ